MNLLHVASFAVSRHRQEPRTRYLDAARVYPCQLEDVLDAIEICDGFMIPIPLNDDLRQAPVLSLPLSLTDLNASAQLKVSRIS